MSPLLGCPDDCAMCANDACTPCGRTGPPACQHDVVERHHGSPRMFPALARTLTPTLPLAKPLLGLRIEIDCQNPDQLADLMATSAEIVRAKIANTEEAKDFIETLGRIAKAREKIVITIE